MISQPLNVKSNQSRATRRLARAAAAALPAVLETLERRQLLSAALSGDQLLINTNNDGADTVTVDLATDGSKIIVSENGSTTEFSLSGVARMQINTAGGNDRITVSSAVVTLGPVNNRKTFVLPRALIIGGNGNDTIQGGRGADEIFGDIPPLVIGPVGPAARAFGRPILKDNGTGDDLINGGIGNDTISAGNGFDTASGGDGNDVIHGGAGSDHLELDGSAGNDTVFGDTDEDRIYCGTGADGSDLLSGGTGGAATFDILDYSRRAGNLTVAVGQNGASGEAGEADTIKDDFELIYGGAGADHFVGTDRGEAFNSGAGPDLVEGRGGNDSLFGFFGNDTILGGDGDDKLDGQDDSNQLDGGPGNDSLTAGFQRDTFVGGDGADTVSYDFYTNNLKLEADGIAHSGQEGENDLISTDIEGLIGGRGNDSLRGSEKSEIFIGGAGNDTIFGFDGDDRIEGGDGNDQLRGGAGNDTIDGGLGADDIESNGLLSRRPAPAQPDVDVLDYSQRTENLTIDLTGKLTSGAPGEGDKISGTFGVVLAGSGNDTVIGTDAAEKIFGRGGNDVIDGSGGDDQITAGEGDDAIKGGAGNDTMRGEAGNDRLAGDAGADVFIGGPGTDTLNYSSRTDALSLFLDNKAHSGASGENDLIRADFEIVRGGSGNDLIVGSNNPETILAGAGNDTVRGNGGNDRLDGGDGNDLLLGGDGNDILLGRAGIDTLKGENGNDTLFADDATRDILDGGQGTDRFRADTIDTLLRLETRL